MRCIECDRPAVTLCRVCFAGQCEAHLAQNRQAQAQGGALAGCSHGTRQAAKG